MLITGLFCHIYFFYKGSITIYFCFRDFRGHFSPLRNKGLQKKFNVQCGYGKTKMITMKMILNEFIFLVSLPPLSTELSWVNYSFTTVKYHSLNSCDSHVSHSVRLPKQFEWHVIRGMKHKSHPTKISFNTFWLKCSSENL